MILQSFYETDLKILKIQSLNGLSHKQQKNIYNISLHEKSSATYYVSALSYAIVLRQSQIIWKKSYICQKWTF